MSLKDLLDRWLTGDMPPPPVARLLGIELVAHAEGTGTVGLDAGRQHHNAMGTLHGGVLCDLADVAMGVAMATVLDDDQSFTTLGLQISYFQAVNEGRLTAVGRVVRRGRTTAYCECEILDEGGTLLAKAAETCLVTARPPR